MEKETTVKEIYKRLDDAASRSDVIEITGEGEPTLHHKLPQFIAYAKNKGIGRIVVGTNGMLFYYGEYAEKLKESGLDACNVSLFSHKAGINDAITRVRGSYEYTIGGLLNMMKRHIDILSIIHTVNELNYRDLVDFVIFAQKFKPGCVSLNFIRPIDTELSRKITPRLSDVKEYLYAAFDYCREKAIKVSMCGHYGVPLCFMEGFESYSTELEIYLREGAKEHKEQCQAREKIKDKNCARCVLNDRCCGIAKSYAAIYGTGELVPRLACP